MLTGNAVSAFRNAIAASGLTPPDTIIADGKRHRFASSGKRGDDAGWYVMHLDGVPAGAFGCWRAGVSEKWRADLDRKLSPVEAAADQARVAAMKVERDAEEAERQKDAKRLAAKLWKEGSPASTSHPYLARKGVKAHGIKERAGLLLVPMRDADGELWNVERIPSDPDAAKKGLYGGRRTGLYHAIGKPSGTIIVVEGYATGASLHDATGHAVAVAFNAGNLSAVAGALRAKHPNARIILAADDDAATPGNPGLSKACEAARAVGGEVIVPDFGPDRPAGVSDFNDMSMHRGAEAVREAVERASAREVSTPQPATPSAVAVDCRLRVLNLGELLTHAFPPREEILAPWLLTQSLNLVSAWRGVGKTHFAAGVAYAVATGGAFLNWQAPRPRRVLYLDGEMPGPAIQGRFRAMVESDERDFDPGNLLTLTPDAQDGPLPDLATLEGQDAVAALAELHNIELIIVDNISTLCRTGGAENEAESWRGPQDWALRMRRAGRAVLFVHHEGKNGQQRGSSKREDTLDVSITLKRPADYRTEEGARFEIHFEKYRPPPGEHVRALEARLETDAHGRAVWTCRSVEEGSYQRVVELAGTGFKPGEIAGELGIHKSNVSRHLARARAEGLLSGAA